MPRHDTLRMCTDVDSDVCKYRCRMSTGSLQMLMVENILIDRFRTHVNENFPTGQQLRPFLINIVVLTRKRSELPHTIVIRPV